jgi:hypothetical protein
MNDEELEATKKLNGVAKENNREEDIKKLNRLIEGCKECKFAACEQCEINWTEVQAIEHILAEREEDKKKIDKLEESYEEQNDELWERVKQCHNMQTEIDNLYNDNEELEKAYLHEKFAKEDVEKLLENSIPKQKVKEIFDRLHISDIEPWSTYKVSGDILFDLKELLEDK